MDQANEFSDAHTVYHIKGDVVWVLGPKAKLKIIRGQWGRELKDVSLAELLKLENDSTHEKLFFSAKRIYH